MMERISVDEYYIGIAKAVSVRGTCLRRVYGAVIVNNDEIISTGYNGSPRGEENCCDAGQCERERLGCKPGEHYELCCAVHAEQNCVISASRAETIGSTIYLAGYDRTRSEWIDARPCKMCRRMLINAGVQKIVAANADGTIYVSDVLCASDNTTVNR